MDFPDNFEVFHDFLIFSGKSKSNHKATTLSIRPKGPNKAVIPIA